MKKPILLGLALAGLPFAASAADMAALKAEAIANMKQFGGTLKGELQAAMKAGGPINAIPVCNEKAPQIAATLSEKSGWDLGRTSLKLRNPDNAPDAWEKAVLGRFEARKAAGEDPAKLAVAEIVEADGVKTYRFMKAIPTGKVCLNCHGAKIKPAIAAKLSQLYPDDAARGFKIGDIRGAFTFSKRLN